MGCENVNKRYVLVVVGTCGYSYWQVDTLNMHKVSTVYVTVGRRTGRAPSTARWTPVGGRPTLNMVSRVSDHRGVYKDTGKRFFFFVARFLEPSVSQNEVRKKVCRPGERFANELYGALVN